ncbi:hypothetical protein QRX46_08165 [Bifidobacterium sp. H1HS10N]|uniref:hypothetical protein n=1 Tax=Bifidobacterium kimbladii TaxID=1293826 RepID=UPI0028BE7B4C|nr:hypothetical protein [Bifidobacterium sp. H1HS10N]MDT7513388.1 hypothetical protein [Bifidobacterium sp. H1HS10N]
MTTTLHNPDGTPIATGAGTLALGSYADGSPALLAIPADSQAAPQPISVNLAGWFGLTPGDKTWIPESQEQAIAPLVAAGQLTPEDAIPTARYGIQGRCAASLYTISPALLDQAHA